MRKDLNKLLCERERPRSDDHYANYRHLKKFEERDYEFEDGLDEPFTGVGSGHREPMKRRYGYDAKPFNENLNPLYGFIHKAVGRKWDKVYSEICEVFDKRSVINQHILIHLFQKVEIDDIRIGEDGKLYYCPTMYGGTRQDPLKESAVEYYVDPRDGILKYNYGRKTYRQVARESAKRRAEEEAKVRRVIDSNTVLEKINNCWFEVKYVDNKKEVINVLIETPHSKRNWYYEKTIYRDPYGNTTSDAKTRLGQRQLSHKELKKYGVVND
jgi:hypothetical protein